MYSINLGFDEADKRFNNLLANGHHAEALLSAVFTFEKILKRSLKYCLLARGIPTKHVNDLLDKPGFDQLLNMWPAFSIDHRKIPELLGNKWDKVKPAKTMRNKMVHGERVYRLDECEVHAKSVWGALKEFQRIMNEDYKFDPWKKIRVRKKSKAKWYF